MDVEKLVLNAIQNNKFIEFLEGKEHMDIGHSSHFSNLPVPTDWPDILENGIYKIYKDGCEYDIKKIFEDSIIDMLDRKAFDIYCAIELWYMQFENEKNDDSPFTLNKELIVNIRNSMSKNKKELERFYEWQGRNEEEGMWGYMKRINQCCETYYGFKIL
ncbi:hypothetical protein [Clostridium sp.]|uniref:hypothetical protein n=1 Tax=Clostridium sp. TaxID=1506 RepID=UPI003FD70A69